MLSGGNFGKLLVKVGIGWTCERCCHLWAAGLDALEQIWTCGPLRTLA